MDQEHWWCHVVCEIVPVDIKPNLFKVCVCNSWENTEVNDSSTTGDN